MQKFDGGRGQSRLEVFLNCVQASESSEAWNEVYSGHHASLAVYADCKMLLPRVPHT